MQAKKVVGVGLGNIFGNAPIKLRSSDVRPSIRKHDIPSAEKKDSPELKVCLVQVNNVACLREELCVCCVTFVQWHFVSIVMETYRTNKPGGAVKQLVPSTASVPFPCYAVLIHYIQHLLTHLVDMPILIAVGV